MTDAWKTEFILYDNKLSKGWCSLHVFSRNGAFRKKSILRVKCFVNRVFMVNKQTNLIQAFLHPGLAWIAQGLDWISLRLVGEDLGSLVECPKL